MLGSWPTFNMIFFAPKGVLESAEDLAGKLGRSNHFPGLTKKLEKVTLPRELVPIAQTFIDDITPDGFSDFQIAYGLAFLLAKEGSKKSWTVIEGFAERAIAAAEGDTVVNPAELFARYLPKSDLKKRMAAMEEERVSASEAAALGRRLKLPVEEDDWSARVWIGKAVPNMWFGAMQNAPQLLLALDPKDKPDWKLDARGKNGDGIYSNWAGDVSQDDFGLPKLAKLEDFPSWIAGAANKLKTTFSIEDAIIKVGRKKKAADPIRKWLRG
jgi:hypothetical protein